MTEQQSGKAVRILLVEDDAGDVLLTREAFRESSFKYEMSVVQDGEEALRFLRRQPPYERALRPDLVLLDLNMPRKDGREVLEEVKGDPELNLIPVAVLTTSAAEEDILKAYHLHANCYIRKPIEMQRFIEVMQEVGGFWFGTATLPPQEPGNGQ
jgi:CheY-like chemotaxis protein